MNEWVLFYLIGCIAAFILLVFNATFFWFLRWITKTNILLRNMKKVSPPDETPFGLKVLKVVGMPVLEATLSWINVLVALWQLIRVLFESLREALTPIPERVRALRFPLRNNPDLPAESVWAHMVGLKVVAGQPLTEPSDVLQSLEEVAQYYPRFDRRRALLQLQALHVAETETVSAALTQLDAAVSRPAWLASG